MFGIGLILSGMTDPGKVLGFLDLAGRWDPSLAFVMGGAIVVGVFAFALAGRRGRTLPRRRDAPADAPRHRHAAWWRAARCSASAGDSPASARGRRWSSLGAGIDQAAVFVAAMLAGMVIYDAAERLIHAPRRRAKA